MSFQGYFWALAGGKAAFTGNQGVYLATQAPLQAQAVEVDSGRAAHRGGASQVCARKKEQGPAGAVRAGQLGKEQPHPAAIAEAQGPGAMVGASRSS